MDPFLIAYKRKTHRILTILSGCMMSTSGYTSSDKDLLKQINYVNYLKWDMIPYPNFPTD